MIWYWALGWFITILALLGNGSVFFLIVFKRSLHTITNWFILSLAVADFTAALTFLPVRYFANFHYNIDLGHAGLWYKFCFTFLYSSTTNLCVLTMDRYMAVSKPFKYAQYMNRKKAIFLIFVAWLFPLIFFTLPAALSYRDNEVFTMVSEINRIFVFQVFPSIFFVLVTLRLILTARKITRQCYALEAQVRYNHAAYLASCKSLLRPERRTSIMIILIITLFNITYAGGNVICYCFVTKTCVLPNILDKIIRLFYIIHLSANPFVYAFYKKDIRKCVKILLRKFAVN